MVSIELLKFFCEHHPTNILPNAENVRRTQIHRSQLRHLARSWRLILELEHEREIGIAAPQVTISAKSPPHYW
jgi:hypothetical protein